MIHCHECGKPLTGALDTFGPWEAPVCWECWTEEPEERREARDSPLEPAAAHVLITRD